MKESPQPVAQRQAIRSAAARSGGGPQGAALSAPVGGIRFIDQAAQRPHRTGLPDRLKDGIEALSGLSMDAVRVHYDSDQPARLGALAYTRGTEIHLGPGQDSQLPHEAWHVVQQLGGGVRPTRRLHGQPINDDARLEADAQTMGSRALQAGGRAAVPAPAGAPAGAHVAPGQTIQRACERTVPAPRPEDEAPGLDGLGGALSDPQTVPPLPGHGKDSPERAGLDSAAAGAGAPARTEEAEASESVDGGKVAEGIIGAMEVPEKDEATMTPKESETLGKLKGISQGSGQFVKATGAAIDTGKGLLAAWQARKERRALLKCAKQPKFSPAERKAMEHRAEVLEEKMWKDLGGGLVSGLSTGSKIAMGIAAVAAGAGAVATPIGWGLAGASLLAAGGMWAFKKFRAWRKDRASKKAAEKAKGPAAATDPCCELMETVKPQVP